MSAVLSLLYRHCYSCQKTKSRLHIPISTVVHAEVVCAPKILPIGIFLSHTLRSKITAPWDMSQYQNFTRISLETSVFYLNFQVRFFLVMLWTRRLDTAAKETWVRGQFSLYREWYGRLMYNTCPIPTETPRLNLLSWSTNQTQRVTHSWTDRWLLLGTWAWAACDLDSKCWCRQQFNFLNFAPLQFP